MLFIGSDTPLEAMPYGPTQAHLGIGSAEPYGHALCRHFTKLHVYAIHGWEGCCCSFLTGQAEKCWSEPSDLTKGEQDREKFARLAESLLKVQSNIELYATWIGGDPTDDEPLLAKRQILVRDLFDPHLYPAEHSAAFNVVRSV